MPSQFFAPLVAGVALALKVAAANEGTSDFQVSCATTVNCETTQTVTSTVPQIFTTTLPGPDASTVTLTYTTTLPAPPPTWRQGQPPAVTKTFTKTVPGETTTETTTTSAPGQPPAVTKTSTRTLIGETTTVTTTETTTLSVPGKPPTSCPPTRTTETRTTTKTATETQTQTPTDYPPCEPCPPCEDCPPCPTDSSGPEGGCSVPVGDWQDLQLEWNSKFSKPGQPEPVMLTISYEFPTILEITDDLVSGEQYTVYLGAEKLGKTSDPVNVGSDTCGQDAEKCIEEGYSHGSFQIPEGAQFITITWEDADQDAGFGSGQYRFSRETPCDELRFWI